MHPGQVGAGQAAGGDAGGDDQAVEADEYAVVQLHLSAGDVECGGGPAEAEVGVQLVQVLVRAQQGALGFPPAVQNLLGQRWPIVRRIRLVADQDECPVEASAAEGLGRSEARGGGADDDDRRSLLSLFIHPDRQGRADRGGLPDVVGTVGGRVLGEQDDDAVLIPLVEHVGGGQHALARGDALVLIDEDLHGSFFRAVELVVATR